MKALVSKNTTFIQQVVPDDQTFDVHEDLFWVPAPDNATTDWSFKEGIVVPPESPNTSYEVHRRFNYPSIQEQLDTLYHEGYDGWKASITAVKQQFPKE